MKRPRGSRAHGDHNGIAGDFVTAFGDDGFGSGTVTVDADYVPVPEDCAQLFGRLHDGYGESVGFYGGGLFDISESDSLWIYAGLDFLHLSKVKDS